MKILLTLLLWLDQKHRYYQGIPTISNGKLIYKYGDEISKGAAIFQRADKIEADIVYQISPNQLTN